MRRQTKQKHNTIYVGNHHTQNKNKQSKNNTICVGHQSLYTRHKTKTKKKEKKTHTICVGHHYAQTNTNNVNKTWALVQTTGGKDKPNIVICGNRNGHHKTKLST
jgi:hypothetical protein